MPANPRRVLSKRKSMSNKPIDPKTLRTLAEARISEKPAIPTNRSTEAILHELQVHQIELEIQNEELRRAHTTLEESRDRYVDLFEFAPAGYFTLSSSGLIEEVNLTGAFMLGIERKRLLHKRFARFIVAEDQDQWHQHLIHMLTHSSTRSCEMVLKRSEADRFDAHLDCMCRTGPDNLPELRIAVTDITEHKRAENELRIAAIAFESQEGILVTDAEGVIMRVNKAFTRLTGYSAEEVIGHTLAFLKSERHDDFFYRNLWTTLKNKHHWQGEVWNRCKNGKIYAEWMTISAVTHNGDPTHYVGTISDITQNVEAEAEIHRLAYYDALTQLPNRRLLLDRLGQAMAASKRSSRHGAVMFLDLDRFKTLNDTRGHDVGDLLLIEVAQRLHKAVREGDTIARLGGDEFVIVLENLGLEVDEAAVQTEQVGEKVLESLFQPFSIAGEDYHGSTSIGIVLFHNHDESIETLLKQADLALYQAKSGGGNCLRFFDMSMQAALNERSTLEADLRVALQKQQFELFYQAQIDRDRNIIGAEALLRWLHPRRGMLGPNEFIPLAEETGQILPIGNWVLKTGCAQLKAWSSNPATRDLRLAINVSPRQFRQNTFVEEVRQALEDSGADPTRLKIELTERLVVENVPDTIVKMDELRKLGIGFSMDDFGTGYSSLSQLSRLPLEQLKIDGSFVSSLSAKSFGAPDSNNATIVQTIINMGRSLGLNVIAEGVETEAQLECLDNYDCATFQGNVFNRPEPLAEFEKRLIGFTTQSIE